LPAINEGRGWIVYSGHGSEESWADGPPLSQAQVYNLTKYCLSMGPQFACITGQYGRPECFGETWQRVYSGAVCFLGSSVSSYWDQDDILEKSIRKVLYCKQKHGLLG
jgi:hypothetical protein